MIIKTQFYEEDLAMFKTKVRTRLHTHYDGLNIGHAAVFMNRNNHATIVDFIYQVDEDGNWHFYYEKRSCLTEEEKTELENWFICYG